MQAYRVEDLPPGKAGAFMPVPGVTKNGATWGLVDVWGAPGTLGVPAPSPDGPLPALSSAGPGPNSGRGSDQSPDVIFPILYVASPANMGPAKDARLGMTRRRRCELPVPAGNPTRLAQSQTLVTKKGGRVTQPWPQAFQRYPTQAG